MSTSTKPPICLVCKKEPARLGDVRFGDDLCGECRAMIERIEPAARRRMAKTGEPFHVAYRQTVEWIIDTNARLNAGETFGVMAEDGEVLGIRDRDGYHPKPTN